MCQGSNFLFTFCFCFTLLNNSRESLCAAHPCAAPCFLRRHRASSTCRAIYTTASSNIRHYVNLLPLPRSTRYKQKTPFSAVLSTTCLVLYPINSRESFLRGAPLRRSMFLCPRLKKTSIMYGRTPTPSHLITVEREGENI